MSAVVVVTVTQVTPLLVRERGGQQAVPAKVVRGSSYTPTAGDRAVAVLTPDRFYLMGGA